MTARRVGNAGLVAAVIAASALLAGQQASPDNTVTVVGTVRLPNGSPVRRAAVSLSKVYTTAFDPEGARVGPQLSASTDLSGDFRITNVPPDHYRVLVTHPSYPPLAVGMGRPDDLGIPSTVNVKGVLFRLDIVMPLGATITGRITDERGRPVPEVRVAPFEARFIEGEAVRYPGIATTVVATDVLGEYRIAGLLPGRYYLRAIAKGTWPGRGPDETFAFPTTFYPGVASAAAQAIDVQAGENLEGVDFSLTGTSVTHVSGFVQSSRGEPIARANVMLQAAQRGSPYSNGFSASDETLEDGRFLLTHIAPGDYLLTTTNGSLFVTVPSSGLDNVVLVQRKSGGTVRGVIVTDRGEAPPFPPAGVAVVTISLPDDEAPARPPSIQIGVDWSFRLVDIRKPRLIRLTGLPVDYAISAVFHDGEVITDRPIEVSDGEPAFDNVRIVVTQSTGRAAGRVMRTANAPAVSALVVVFADDPSKWGLASRFVRSGYTDAAGMFDVQGLLPGAYRIVAPRTILPGQWQNADYLRSVAGSATRFTVAAGQTDASLQLTVGP